MRRFVLVVGLLFACGPTAALPSVSSSPSVFYPKATPIVAAKPEVPVRLRIPALKIDSPITTVGLMPDGSVGTPCDPTKPFSPCNTNATAWYKYSVKPGEHGSAVIDGHVDWYGPVGSGRDIPAVFANLNRIKVGTPVKITDKHGMVRTFKVDIVVSLPYPKQPKWTYAIDGPISITLITCAGAYVNAATGMSSRLYVHAVAVSSS